MECPKGLPRSITSFVVTVGYCIIFIGMQWAELLGGVQAVVLSSSFSKRQLSLVYLPSMIP